MNARPRSIMLSAALTVAALSACAHANIPGTEIEDTEENREILTLVEEYKQAVERLDADAVLALVSPRFYEDNGNTNEADDYDYNGLAKSLKESFERTRAMQLVLRIDAVEVEDADAYAEVYYEIRAHNEYPSGMKWETETDRSRFRFERVDDKWLIIAGL